MTDELRTDPFLRGRVRPSIPGSNRHPKGPPAPPAGGTQHTLNPSDTITLSDAPSRAVKVSRADTLTLSDARTKNAKISRADTLTLSDVIDTGANGITGTPYWVWNGESQLYQPLSTIFETVAADSHIDTWGGLEANLYDTTLSDNGIIMSRDPALRVALVSSPTNPNGTGWVSRHEIKASDPAQNPGGSSTYDRSTIRNLTSDTLNQAGVTEGMIRWFAWDFFLPNDFNGDTFNWSMGGGWHTIADLHSGLDDDVLSLNVRPINTLNNVYLQFRLKEPFQTSVHIPVLQLSDGSGNRILSAFNVWHELVVGVKLASDDSGWAEVWFDGEVVQEQVAMQTIDEGDDSQWMQAQNYKQHGDALVGGAASTVIYHGGMRAGMTQADVQRIH